MTRNTTIPFQDMVGGNNELLQALIVNLIPMVRSQVVLVRSESELSTRIKDMSQIEKRVIADQYEYSKVH